MRRLHFLAVYILTLVSACSFGQQMPDTTPPKQITDLAWCVGDWSASVNWTAPGMPTTSQDTLHCEIDGQFLKMQLTSDMGGFKMTETSYTGWDGANKRYTSYAFSNISPEPRIEHGSYSGDTWVSESEPWHVMGQETIGRATSTKKSDTEMTMLLEFKMGDNWTKIPEGTFKKSSEGHLTHDSDIRLRAKS